jgi:hypothetical protein
MLRGLIVWLVIMVVETIHGVLRILLLVPRLGEATSGRIGLLVGTVLVMVVTVLLIRWTGLRRGLALLGLGAVWAGLTALFEVLIGVLRGLDAARIWAEVNPAGGGPMLYMLCVMFLAPWLSAKLSGIAR